MLDYFPKRGRKYPRGIRWRENRRIALSRAHKKCQVCEVDCVPTVDHVISERFIRKFLPEVDPHGTENLIALCRLCHGRKTGVDRKLWKGPDVLGFTRALEQLNWPKVRIAAAFKYCGMAL